MGPAAVPMVATMASAVGTAAANSSSPGASIQGPKNMDWSFGSPYAQGGGDAGAGSGMSGALPYLQAGGALAGGAAQLSAATRAQSSYLSQPTAQYQGSQGGQSPSQFIPGGQGGQVNLASGMPGASLSVPQAGDASQSLIQLLNSYQQGQGRGGNY